MTGHGFQSVELDQKQKNSQPIPSQSVGPSTLFKGCNLQPLCTRNVLEVSNTRHLFFLSQRPTGSKHSDANTPTVLHKSLNDERTRTNSHIWLSSSQRPYRTSNRLKIDCPEDGVTSQ